MYMLCSWFLYNVGLTCSGCCSEIFQQDLRGKSRINSIAARSHDVTTDVVCSFAADSGPCNVHYIIRWFYDQNTGQCHQFMYGGCAGNQNNFLTKSNCIQSCQSDTAVVPKTVGRCPSSTTTASSSCTNVFPESADRCLQTIEYGSCRGSFPRWYFDRHRERCLPFQYTGCNGNRNRFLTREICRTECRSKMTSVRHPLLPSIDNNDESGEEEEESIVMTSSPDGVITEFDDRVIDGEGEGKEGRGGGGGGLEDGRGEEEGIGGGGGYGGGRRGGGGRGEICFIERDNGLQCSHEFTVLWYFDSTSRTCQRFRYSGCHGNANRFSSLEECQKTCLSSKFSDDEVKRSRPRDIVWKKGASFIAGIKPLRKKPDRSPQPLKPSLTDVTHDNHDDVTRRRQLLISEDADEEEEQPWKRKELLSDGDDVVTRRRQLLISDGYDVKSASKARHVGRKNDPFVTSRTPSAGPEEDEKSKEEIYWQHDKSEENEDIRIKTTIEESKEEFKSFITDDVIINRCRLPKEVGVVCSKWQINWFYDVTVYRCRRFYYGGCHGNENRFQAEEECERACAEPYDRFLAAAAVISDL